MKHVLFLALAARMAACSATPSAVAPPPPPPPTKVADLTRVMLITLNGELGRDITKTPLRRIMNDAKQQKPDCLIFKIDCTTQFQDRLTPEELERNPQLLTQASHQLDTIRELDQYFTDDIRFDREWTARTESGKPRLVMWVNQAVGCPALLPWVAPEICFTSNGRLGGLANLELFIWKQAEQTGGARSFSLRIARAKGLAEKGGHDPRLVMAMCEANYVLSVSYVDLKPVYFENESGDEIIKDDGDPKKGRADDKRGVGNDFLTFNAASARKLGVSRGTADTLDDLKKLLGITGETVELQSAAESIFKNWAAEVTAAKVKLNELGTTFTQIKVEGDTPALRNQCRTRQLELLKHMEQLLKKYGEAIPSLDISGADPKLWNDVATQIESLRSAMNSDR